MTFPVPLSRIVSSTPRASARVVWHIVRQFNPNMNRVKKILIVVVAGCCLIALVYALGFTTAEVPAYLVKPEGSVDGPAGKTQRALVAKLFRLERLKPGDLILVARRNDNGELREIRRLEKVEPPDEAERSKVPPGGRHPHSRTIAQAILDMDFRPKYWVSATDGTNSVGPVRIAEADIKGAVIWIRTK